MRVNTIQPRLVYRTTVCNGVLFFFDAELGSFLKPLGPFFVLLESRFCMQTGKSFGKQRNSETFFQQRFFVYIGT